jgi:urea transport system substrate-binding protein
MKSSQNESSTPSRVPIKRPLPSVNRRRFLHWLGYTSAGMGLANWPMLDLLSSAVAKPSKVFSTPRQTITVDHGKVIKVGILHSQSGTMAIAEERLIEAELLAIAEINQNGGILGKRLQPIIADGASDWPTFREQAQRLIKHDQVATVFGGWTSACRKAMLPVFENANHLLWYPVYYEGQECARNIFYTGMVPNQQVEPTVKWMMENFANQPIFLVGSDYVFPRVVNTTIKQKLSSQSRSRPIVGEDYLPLGSSEVESLIRQIKTQMPKGGIIFSSLNGDSNIDFFRQLKQLGLSPKQYPVISFGIAEGDLIPIRSEYLQGHYLARSYFETVNTAANTKFIKAFKAKYGRDSYFNDVMQSAYTAVYLWKQAVIKAGTATHLDKVRAAAIGQSFNAPEGQVTLTQNHHLTKPARIGQIRPDGRVTIVYETKALITPQPWSQSIPETKGFACDWSNPARGGKYKP